MLHLEKITPANVWDVIDLKVKKHQKNFVASNSVSIVQAYSAIGTKCTAMPFAICNEKRPVRAGRHSLCCLEPGQQAQFSFFRPIRAVTLNSMG